MCVHADVYVDAPVELPYFFFETECFSLNMARGLNGKLRGSTYFTPTPPALVSVAHSLQEFQEA